MANYRCTAACRHCLYSCSPDRTDGYITEKTANEVCKLLKRSGCYSVHIGGGEPFIDIDGLIKLIKCINKSGIRVEYIETNAYWATNEDRVKEYLEALREAGANTLCFRIRHWLSENIQSPDLDREYYIESLKFYEETYYITVILVVILLII